MDLSLARAGIGYEIGFQKKEKPYKNFFAFGKPPNKLFMTCFYFLKRVHISNLSN